MLDLRRQIDMRRKILALWILCILALGGVAHAAGDRAYIEEQFLLKVYMLSGVVSALWFLIAFIFGLLTVRGQRWWRVVARLVLLVNFLLMSILFYMLNLGFLMSHSGRTITMMTLNLLPAVVMSLLVYWFRGLGLKRFSAVK